MLVRNVNIGKYASTSAIENTPSTSTRIREARLQKGFTQLELANLIGLKYYAISCIEKSGKFRLETLKKLSKALDKPAAYLGCFENMPESTFQERFKKARHYHSFDLITTAKYLGVNQRTIYMWENGLSVPNNENIKKIYEFMRILDK